MKRVIMILFMLILVGMFSVSVAEETLEEGTMVVSGVVEEDIDNDFLFNMYAESLFGYGAPSFYRANHNFSEDMQEFYDFLVTCIKEVAAGERISTEFTIEKTFTLTQEELNALVYALVYDYPYEMYWYDEYLGHTYVSFDEISTVFSFSVLDEYAAGEFSVDNTKMEVAKKAAENAKAIVDRYASYSDVQKLIGYRNTICNMVSYDYDAANADTASADQNAWQLIYVFDGDNKTNVVCEGYAKAFQYLCDITLFDDDIFCYTVTGDMNGVPHAWNMLRMSDGKNYLADITNVDEDYGCFNERLFLAGYMSGSLKEGYSIDDGAYGAFYQYDDLSLNLFEDEELVISNTYYLMGDSYEDSYEEAICGDWKYRLHVGEVTITEYTGCDEKVVVPSEIDGFPVIRIASDTFSYNDKIESIVFSEGIKYFEEMCINVCVNLAEVFIPSTVNFSNSGYESTWIERVPALEAFYVSPDNEDLCSLDGVIYSKNMKLLKNYPMGKKDEIFVIPDGVEMIGMFSFRYNSYLRKVVLPDSTEDIEYCAFSLCNNLSEINISRNCYHIGQYTFQGTAITALHIPASMTQIDPLAFLNTRIRTITVDENNPNFKMIDGSLCGINVLYPAPDGNLYLGNMLMYYLHGQDRTAYTIPAEIEFIQIGAFDNITELTMIVIPNTMRFLSESAFLQCDDLRVFYLPYDLEPLSNRIENGIPLDSKYFPDGSVLIGERGSIAERAVEYYLGRYYFVEIGQEIISGACGENVTWEFDYTLFTLKLSGSGDTYDYEYGPTHGYAGMGLDCEINHAPWFGILSLIKKIEIEGNITRLGSSLFHGIRDTERIPIPDTVVSIGDYTFAECNTLDNIQLPDGMTNIGYYAFMDCYSLDELVFPETLKHIGDIGLTKFPGSTSTIDFCKAVILSRECIIEPDIFLYDHVEIHGYYGSTAHQYAEKYGCKFALLDECLQHNIVSYSIAAGCETTGLSDGSYCTICNEVFEEPVIIPELGHAAGVWRMWTNATYEKEGLKKRQCPRCYFVYETAVIPSMKESGCAEKGHSEITDAEVSATCLSYGLTEGKHCAVCGDVLVTQEYIPEFDHHIRWCNENVCMYCGAGNVGDYYTHKNIVLDYDDVSHKEWCEECGAISTEGLHLRICTKNKCEICSAPYNGENVIHQEGKYIEDNGYHWYNCSACGYTTEKQEHSRQCIMTVCDICGLPYTGDNFWHPYIFMSDTEGHWMKCLSCEHESEREEHRQLCDGTLCLDCGNYCVGGKLVHTNITSYATVLPTCLQSGLTEGELCNICGVTIYGLEEIPALGHSEVILEAVSATCTQTGLTEGKHCSVCGVATVKQEEIAALGHKEEIIPGKAATCTETGLTEGKKCTVCGVTTVEQEEIAALGHKEEIIPGKAATCTETGLTEGKKCTVCGVTTVEQEEIAALGHKEEIIPGKAATCTETGLTEGKHCSVCNEVLVKQEVVAAKGHTEAVDEAVEATCTKTGLTEGVHCAICDEIIKMQEEIPAAGHDEGAWVVVTEVTNDTDGLKELRCTVCETVLETEVIPKLEEDKPKRLPGDVSGDGIIDGRDLLRLAKYIGGFEVEITIENASVNGDDVVDGRDLLRLAKYIGGFEVELE